MRTSRYEGLNGLGGSLLAQGAACLNGLGGSLWGAACLLLHSRLGGLRYYLKGTFLSRHYRIKLPRRFPR